jgi:trans-aconitate 2-methyltransferase
VDEPDAFGPEVYLEVLRREGWNVDAWETTYLHVLTGDDAVFTWVSATGPGRRSRPFPTDSAKILSESSRRASTRPMRPVRVAS